MRKVRVVAAAIVAALAVASAAFGATMYAGPRQWASGMGAGSSYSASWHENDFDTYGSGYDKAVTFIDNKSYGWHNTVRNRNGETKTYSPWPLTVKAHCVAYDTGFWGSCTVW
jgi:hypothetical protein